LDIEKRETWREKRILSLFEGLAHSNDELYLEEVSTLIVLF
jgi:hypothetical protein